MVAGDNIVPAMKAWVLSQNKSLEQSQKSIANAIREFTIDQETGKREAAERERDRLELDALKVTDEQERLKVLQLKRRTDETIVKLNERIKRLESMP